MNRQLGLIMVILMTVFTGFGIIIPVMPEMIKDAGAASVQLGLMLGIYSAASFIMSPLWGGWSDRIGRRPIIMIGVLGFSASFFLFGIAGDQLWLMYASRILGGIFSGAATACSVAYVADSTDEDNRTKGMGLVGMSIGLGFIFGPAIGGLLSIFGNAVPFFAASILSLITFVFAWKALPESLPEAKRTSKTAPKVSRWTAFRGAIKYLYVLAFFVSFTLAGLEGTLQYFHIATFGVTSVQMGAMFFVSGVVGALIQGGVVRRYIKKGDEPKFIRLGLLLSAAGFFLLLFTTGFWTATLFLSVFAAGNALIRPCVTSLITRKATVGQGVATGLSSSMDSLGRIVGPILGGVAFHYQIHLPFIIGGVLSLGATLLLIRYVQLDMAGGRTASS